MPQSGVGSIQGSNEFGFQMNNLTISDPYFQRFPYQIIDNRNCAEFSSTAQLQISFVTIILRQPVELSLIESRILCHF